MKSSAAAIGLNLQESDGATEGLEETAVTTGSTSTSEDSQDDDDDLESTYHNEDEPPTKEDTLENDRISQQSFPFMKLPPEIRNMVYEKALFVPEAICIELIWPAWYWYHPPKTSHDGLRTIGHSPGETCQLLQTCKDIYYEASLVYYHHNTFYCNGVETLGEFLSILTVQQRRHIQSLSFFFKWERPGQVDQITSRLRLVTEAGNQFHTSYVVWL